MSEGFPVYAVVGNTKVRVGTAHKHEDGFSIAFGGLSIGGAPDAAPAPRRAPSGDGGAVFPPFGRSKGAPIHGASMQDLNFYAGAARRSLDDPSKSRWHAKEQALLDIIEAEIARQSGGSYMPPKSESRQESDEDSIPF